MCPPPLFYRQINCLSLPSAPPCHMQGTRSLRIADVHLRQKHIRKTYIYMLSSSRTVMSFLSNGLSERMASLNGT